MAAEAILRERREEILRIAARHGASNVRIFGSAVRGEDSPESDIDFLVDMDEDRSLFDHIALIDELGELLGRKVDVMTEKSVYWLLKRRILQEARPL
jgi:predicted nucleotidyltransferase